MDLHYPNISIAGPDEAGKSTTARLISERICLDVYSFGSQVKRFAVEQGYLTEKQAYTKPTTQEARLVFRALGDGLRYVNPDIWVTKLAEVISPRWVIDDNRYENERSWAKGQNAFTVFLNAPFDATVPSFKELHYVRERCDLVLQAKSSSPENLVEQILKAANG